jgi:hypothetical protein
MISSWPARYPRRSSWSPSAAMNPALTIAAQALRVVAESDLAA